MRGYCYLLCAAFAFVSASGSGCPPEETLKPCTCIQDTSYDIQSIDCDKPEIKEFKSILGQAKSHVAPDLVFADFFCNSKSLEELPEDAFNGLKFKIMRFEGTTISKIHPNAFGATAATLEVLDLMENKLTNESPNEYGIFDLMMSLPKLKRIDLTDNRITSIPEKAFRPKAGTAPILTNLDLTDNKVKEVKPFGFYAVPTLFAIHLYNNEVEKIHKNAFAFSAPLEKYYLVISLGYNKLTAESFEDGAFEGMQRQAEIYFHNNQISYLKESVFKPYLDANEKNILDIGHQGSNPIVCDCRMKWLVEGKERYQKQVRAYNGQITCSGKSIFELSPSDLKC